MNFLFELLLEKTSPSILLNNSIKSSAIASFDHLTVKLRMQKLDLEAEKNLAFFSFCKKAPYFSNFVLAMINSVDRALKCKKIFFFFGK